MANILKKYKNTRGSVFTVLMFGVGMAAAMSVATYQMLLGPVSSASAVNQKAIAEAQLASGGRIVAMTAAMGASNGDCDADGYIEMAAFQTTAGPKPVGGGLAPPTMGLPALDPWGTAYGYCVWDVGATFDAAGCGGAGANRLNGADNPIAGTAKTLTVMAIVSAGPDRTFSTTCRNWNNTDDVIISTGTTSDDIVRRYTYTEASVAAGGLWEIKAGSADTVKIDKNLEVGNDITLNQTTGSLEALSVTARGKFIATGGVELGTDATVTVCTDALNVGILRYNNTSNKVEVCTGTAGGWQQAGVTTGVMTELVGGAAAGACTLARDGEIRYVTGESQAWYYCKGSTTTWTPFEQPPLDAGCEIGELIGSGICIGSINGQDIIAAPRGCADAAATTAACSGAERQKTWGTANTTYTTYVSGGADGRAASNAALSVPIGSTQMIAYCDGLTLDGKSWHAPSVAELALMYRTHVSGVMPAAYQFTGTADYASSRSDGNDETNDNVRTIDFVNGTVASGASTATWSARCIYRRPAEARAACLGPVGCLNIGDRCTSGEVFAGCHPQTRNFMFLQACPQGKTWDGSTCTGAVTNTTFGPDTSAANLRATGVVDIFDGAANTVALTNGVVDGTGDAKTTAGVQPHLAAQYCAGLVEGGFSDWYLPAYAEAMPIWTSSLYSFMAPEDYMILSTEVSATQAYAFTRLAGTQYKIFNDPKSTQRPVRCMRSEPGSFSVQNCADNTATTCILSDIRNASDPDFVSNNFYFPSSLNNVLNVFGVPVCTDDATVECMLDDVRSGNDPEHIVANIRTATNILNVTGTAIENVTVPSTYNIANWQLYASDKACLLRPTGHLNCWGEASTNILGNNSVTDQQRPIQVHSDTGIPGFYNWTRFFLRDASSHMCGLRSDATLWCWGTNASGQVGNGTTVLATRPQRVQTDTGPGGWSDWTSAATTDAATCGLRSGGTIWCWGVNATGQLGNGTTTASSRPVQVQTDTGPGGWADWTHIYDGGDATFCGKRTDNSLWCWGGGSNGQLGNGASANVTRPVRVQTNTGPGGWTDWVTFKTSAANDPTRCGLRSTGTLWCWGQGDKGQLGHGSSPASVSRPVQVRTDSGGAGWTDWTAQFDTALEAGGEALTCGIRTDGTLWCWGENGDGTLGDGTTNDSDLPVQVRDSSDTGFWSDWTAVDVSPEFACGLRSNGTLWCWGRGSQGELGHGTENDSSLPVQVQTDTGPGAWSDWTKMHLGWNSVCGIRQNGTVWCWGSGSDGRLGNNDGGTDYSRPSAVRGM